MPVIAFIVIAASANEAYAVVKGRASSLEHYTVRVVGRFHCSGVAIDRKVVVTAGHCAGRGIRIVTGGRSIGVAGVSRRTTLDDGRIVSVSGDAAILRLAAPLPAAIRPVPVGEDEGNEFTIAGYGTVNERYRAAVGKLHEAQLVAAAPFALVDPNRTGSIGASACFGDSGGPVLRGPVLVGVITRAAHPAPHIACGHLTRWAPVTVAQVETAVAAATIQATGEPTEAEAPRKPKRRKTVKRIEPNWNPFWRWTAR
ncbi:MAG: trypsin-like serine protease [Rhizobiales bacterium]|nr:trypsin-like serine protease [Hyphomicrobiales bacterium]